jgi:hypothetical protein
LSEYLVVRFIQLLLDYGEATNGVKNLDICTIQGYNLIVLAKHLKYAVILVPVPVLLGWKYQTYQKKE